MWVFCRLDMCVCAIAWNGLYLPKTSNAPKTFAHLFMWSMELHNNVNACSSPSFTFIRSFARLYGATNFVRVLKAVLMNISELT